MAFLQGFSRALRVSSNSAAGSAGSQIAPFAYILSREFSTQLFVGGLAWKADEQSLVDAFSSYGQIEEAKVIRDRYTGRSKGYGFVLFSNEKDADFAKQEMDGKEIAGRPIRVDYASRKNPADAPHADAAGQRSYA